MKRTIAMVATLLCLIPLLVPISATALEYTCTQHEPGDWKSATYEYSKVNASVHGVSKYDIYYCVNKSKGCNDTIKIYNWNGSGQESHSFSLYNDLGHSGSQHTIARKCDCCYYTKTPETSLIV